MKILQIALLFLLFFACTRKKAETPRQTDKGKESEIIVPEFQNLLDSAKLKGAILIYDLEKDQYYSNDFEWAKKGHLPASTFKIPHSLIALDLGVVKDAQTLLPWDGEERSQKVWEQDLTLQEAFHFSCVPCYQEIARKIGSKRMNEYLNKLDFGRMKLDSSSMDIFWLEGDSRISQFQEIDFLKRFYQSKLALSQRTERIMKKLMLGEEKEGFKQRAKTGWSIHKGKNNGWFVGYLESEVKQYFFASNVEPKEGFDMALFPEIRKEITYRAFQKIGILKESP